MVCAFNICIKYIYNVHEYTLTSITFMDLSISRKFARDSSSISLNKETSYRYTRYSVPHKLTHANFMLREHSVILVLSLYVPHRQKPTTQNIEKINLHAI